MLSKEQVAKFERDGYLVIPEFISKDEVILLKKAGFECAAEFNPSDHPLVRFTTGEEEKHIGDDYFLKSGDKICYFLERDAVDSNGGGLLVSKEKAINKIGHGLHILEPAFQNFSTSDKIQSIARDLGFKRPEILQSMLIFKQPKIGGAVPPHQDSSFLYTDPVSATGLWIPFEDCTEDNGCLYFYPGSHKFAPISRRLKRVHNPAGITEGTELVGEPYPSEFTDPKNYVPVAISAGTLVLIHGSVMHMSSANLSEKSRLAYTFHMIEGEAEYSKDNWLQPTSSHFVKLY